MLDEEPLHSGKRSLHKSDEIPRKDGMSKNIKILDYSKRFGYHRTSINATFSMPSTTLLHIHS